MALNYLQEFEKAISETEPNKLDDLSPQELEAYYGKFSAIYPSLSDFRLGEQCRNRIGLLMREIELRKTEEKADRRHREIHGVGKKTLTWAMIGGVTGILILLIEGFSLVRDTFFSKVPPATLPQSSPNSSLQIPTPTSGLSESEATSNNTTPSPEPTTTVQPSASQPES
jgi:hypothetical protein